MLSNIKILNILKNFRDQIQTIFNNNDYDIEDKKYFISLLIESNNLDKNILINNDISISSKLIINKIVLNILTLYFNDEEIIKDIIEYLF
jgi:hypothetical protein